VCFTTSFLALAARGIMNPYNKLENIYNKHRSQYKENGDSKQMCCMWSTNDPPDIVEGTQPFQDIEKAFSIIIEDNDAFKMYEMTLKEALIRIQEIQKRQDKKHISF
jgi:hypothetical protein